MKRFIIVNRQTNCYDGVYYAKKFAEQSIGHVRESWPGLDWEVQEVDSGFPVPGLRHMGEVGVRAILKAALAEATA